MSKGPIEEFTVAGGDDGSTAAFLDDGVGDPPPPRNRRPWRGPLPWAGCAVVILLLGMALVRPLPTPVGPWGQVPDVTSTPDQVWSLEADEDIYSVRMAGGMLVTTGPQTVRGIDPARGEQLWQVELAGARCTTDTTNLLCADTAGRAVQIDPADGAVTELDLNNAIAVATSGSDLFAITSAQDPVARPGEYQLERIADGEVLWSTPVSVGPEYRSFQDPMAVIAGNVLTTIVMDEEEFGAVGAVFDAATGERLDSTQSYVSQLGPKVWVSGDAEESTLYVRGETEPHVTDRRHVLQYDDDWRSDDVVTMSDEGTLTVHDQATGDLRWRYEQMAYPIARIDGVLLALVPRADSAALQGLQASSGELLWERDDSWMMCPCVADQNTIAGQLQTATQDGTFTSDGPVVGIDAESGAERWRVEAPTGMAQMVTDGRHLVLVSGQQMTGWRLG